MSQDGFEFQMPKDALPPGMDSASVSMTMYLGNPHTKSLPKDKDLASGVLQVQSDNIRLSEKKNAAVQVDHCMNITSEEDRDAIGVVRARGQGSYEMVDKKQIDIRSSSVIVKLQELTSLYLGVVYTVARRRSVSYCGILYRIQKEGFLNTLLRFHFVVIKDLSPCIKVSMPFKNIHCMCHVESYLPRYEAM